MAFPRPADRFEAFTNGEHALDIREGPAAAAGACNARAPAGKHLGGNVSRDNTSPTAASASSLNKTFWPCSAERGRCAHVEDDANSGGGGDGGGVLSREALARSIRASSLQLGIVGDRALDSSPTSVRRSDIFEPMAPPILPASFRMAGCLVVTRAELWTGLTLDEPKLMASAE